MNEIKYKKCTHEGECNFKRNGVCIALKTPKKEHDPNCSFFKTTEEVIKLKFDENYRPFVLWEHLR